jgi:hypothetical protein
MLQLFWILIAAGVALLAAKFSDWLPQIVGGALVLIGAGWVLTSCSGRRRRI